MAPSIRPAGTGDLDLMMDQTWEVAAEGRWIGTEVPFDKADRARRFLETLDSPDAAIFVADASADGGPAVVGHLSVRLAPYGVAEIGMLLAPGYRGQGLGRALLEAAIDWAGTTPAHKLALEVWPHNEAAIALYRKVGFVEEGRKVRHYRRNNGELWDAVIMGLLLA